MLSFLSLCLLINQIRSLKVSSYKWVTKDFKYDFAHSFYKGSPKQDLWAKGCGSGGCRRARSKLFSNTQEMSNNINVVIWFANILKSSYPRSIICQNWRKDVGNSNLQKQMTWTKIYKVCNKMSWMGILLSTVMVRLGYCNIYSRVIHTHLPCNTILTILCYIIPTLQYFTRPPALNWKIDHIGIQYYILHNIHIILH